MRVFEGYRPLPPEEYKAKGLTNGPDRPDYQGCEFDDGTVVLRWLTRSRSTSIFSDWEEFYQIHGHPEYGTVIHQMYIDKPWRQ